MQERSFGFLDRLLGEIDSTIKVLSGAGGAAPADFPGEATALSPRERGDSARLMRVNHAGEVAAQALYQGQALTARTPEVKVALQHAASEERSHLVWCQQRLRELDARPSLLNPVWYAGSLAMGALAGCMGDRLSLGFVAETERQVESHLKGHLDRMSPNDNRSRAILDRMQRDEARHGQSATALGATALPPPVTKAMTWVSKLMTKGSYWV